MKISFGSSTHRPGPDWILVDIDPEQKADIIADAKAYSETLDEESCEEIYSSHLLEHFSRDEGKYLVHLWGKLLKKDGKLWIAVPDTCIIGKMINEVVSDELRYEWIKIMYGWQTNQWDIHKWGYTHDSLYDLMREAGLQDIKRFEPWMESSTGKGKDVSGGWLPNDEDEPIPFSLNLVGVK